MFVITPMCGRVNAHSSAICPKPRIDELEDADLGVRLDAANGERHADLVVEAALRCNGPRLRRADRGEDVLRRGLAHRARDRDEARVTSVAHGACERGERRKRIVGDERGRRAAGERVLAVVDAVAERDEQVAFFDATRVDLHAGDLFRPACAVELSRDQVRDGVQLERDHAGCSARSSSRATSRSSNGWTVPPISCPCSLPLPAISTTSPSRADSIALAIAVRRSGSTSSSGAPVSTSSMIASGSSLRGLSDVTIATSASVPGDASHDRPLLAVAVAAAAEDADHAALREAPRLLQNALERRGLVRVVDDDGERLAFVDELEAPRHALDGLDAFADRALVDPERAGRGRRAQRVLDVEASAQLQVGGELVDAPRRT